MNPVRRGLTGVVISLWGIYATMDKFSRDYSFIVT